MSVTPDNNRVNPDLLRLLPPDARTVVEVGCGAGALAEAYRRINPDVLYLGIEMDSAAARAAILPGRVDRVFIGDVTLAKPTDLGLSEHKPEVECLIFGNVLERIADPWTVLTRLSRWLRDDAQVLACIPNIQHYSVLINLLRGKWDYQDEGLLDRTHLRFFTAAGIQDLFTRAGLQVIEIQPLSVPTADFHSFQQAMEPALRALAIDPPTFAAQTQTMQYLVRAIPASATLRRTVYWSLLGSVVGSEPRIGEPNRFLTTIPGVRAVSCTGLQFGHLDRTWPDESKIFIQQRTILPRADHERFQRELIARGYLIVGEIDDDPQHFPDLARTDHFAIKSCHCLQTTTEVMANTLRPFNPHIAVFPNQIVTLSPRRNAPEPGVAGPPLTIFFGALNREADWAPIMPELNRLLDAAGDKVRVQVVYDRAFFGALKTPHKRFEPLCAPARYHEQLDRADIALLPLEPTRFNQHKSDLKFIECAAHGVAVVASHTVYGDTARHEETALLYSSPDEFGLQLERMISDAQLRFHISNNAYAYVMAHRMLSRHYRRRHEWYLQMLAQRNELERDMRTRVPELFSP
jgi:hypothetical protein